MDADLTKQALSLPLPERLQLVDDLWESILAQVEEIPLTDAQRSELDRRVARYEANPETAKPWSEVRDRLWGQ
jgi:putative addiction module component (TIGR02574 family)